MSGKPFFDSSGKFAGYRGTGRDISERVRAVRHLREAKVEAEAASLAKSRFLAKMSYELRTPLNAILGFSEMLERGTAGPLDCRQQEYVGYIRQSGAHLLHIINEILDLAKIDAGKLELDEDEELMCVRSPIPASPSSESARRPACSTSRWMLRIQYRCSSPT